MYYGADKQAAMNAAAIPQQNGAYGDALGNTKAQPELPAQMSRLASAVESAHDAVRMLAERLDFVLRPHGPQQESPPKIAAVGPSTQAAAHLCASVERVHDLAAHVRDLLDRLEV